ncbi:hypothetical protein EDC61_10857 [Sulfuritortus calidifontis]|uniref:Transcriptional regulator n=1 Tax=Sulfuritortus calidifontis TaxID=1914471 RepID=A0A4R3JUX5_9PROT|nr:ArsR family transcriptional regulator [Sulfuritortus calidifontis]TCS71714.1 hypothetical protein EDC61_10857 [Sulfuritortus calidifontis]
MQEILQYLKANGEQLDADIAAGTGVSLKNVRQLLTELSAKGDVIMCRTTRYTNGKPVEGMLCRASGYIPPASPGRKPKPAQSSPIPESLNPPLRQSRQSSAKK